MISLRFLEDDIISDFTVSRQTEDACFRDYFVSHLFLICFLVQGSNSNNDSYFDFKNYFPSLFATNMGFLVSLVRFFGQRRVRNSITLATTIPGDLSL